MVALSKSMKMHPSYTCKGGITRERRGWHSTGGAGEDYKGEAEESQGSAGITREGYKGEAEESQGRGGGITRQCPYLHDAVLQPGVDAELFVLHIQDELRLQRLGHVPCRQACNTTATAATKRKQHTPPRITRAAHVRVSDSGAPPLPAHECVATQFVVRSAP